MTFEDQFSPKDHAVLKKMGILLSQNQITLANPSKSKGTEEQAKITEIKEIQLVKTNERRFNFWSIITVFSLQHALKKNPHQCLTDGDLKFYLLLFCFLLLRWFFAFINFNLDLLIFFIKTNIDRVTFSQCSIDDFFS